MNATEAIDLCNDTPPPVAAMPLTARHPPSAAAARRKPARDVINLLNDASSSDHSTSQTQGGGTAAAKKKRAYKTDPNERDDDDSDAVELLGSASKKTRYDAVVVVEKQQPPLGPELQILEVFPDIDAEALQTLLQQFQNNVPQVLSYMAENSYKKSEKKASAAQKPDLSLHMGGDGAVWKYDYMSTESFEPTRDYIQQATEHLLSEFKFLSKLGAQNILQKCKNHYAVSHDKIIAAIKGTTGDEDAQYDRLVAALDGRGRKVPSDLTERTRQICDQRCRSPTLKKPRKQSFKVAVSNAILKQEIRFVKNKLLEYMETQSKRRKRLKAQEEAQKQGTAVECSCCFDSYPFDDMVACREEGHLFCSDCLKMYAENQVFGQGNLGIDKRSKQPALELLCCYGGDNGCSSGFDRHYLEKALPPKTLKKYDEVQFTVTVQRAGLSTVCSCPKCGFQADVPETQKVFQCPVAECGYASCRECGEAAHIPLRCVLFASSNCWNCRPRESSSQFFLLTLRFPLCTVAKK